jgi:predicted transcriptional regulator
MTTRINARIDDDLARDLERIRRRSGQTLTATIEAALRAWAERQGEAAARPGQIFAATGFVASGTGPRDLARASRKYLSGSLEKKR